MTMNPIPDPDDDGPVNPPHDPRPRPSPPRAPDDESILSPDEPGENDPTTLRVVDDVYDPRTRTGRTALPGIDPPS